jgi:predicted enzyme related to lactoylglutathione lyase
MQAPAHGQICWNEYLSTDPAAATTFYTELFGWKADGMAGPASGYTILKNGTDPVAGLTHVPAPGIPSHWLSYIMVVDCDTAAKKAEALGGKILSPPTEIIPGRLAIIADPQGAVFGLFTPRR